MGIVKASASKGCSEDWVKYIAGIFQALNILTITTIIVKSVCLCTFTRCTIFFSGSMGIRMDSSRASKLTKPWTMFSAFHAAPKEYKIFREEVDGWRSGVSALSVSFLYQLICLLGLTMAAPLGQKAPSNLYSIPMLCYTSEILL